MSETQPFVGWPISTWMKIAEPRPGTAGEVLYSTKIRCEYARVERHSASLAPAKGGRVPHATCWNVL